MTVSVRIFSDLVCPFCYIGSGVIKKLQQEFDLGAEWVSYELHPETPENGVLLTERFPDFDPEPLFEELRTKGAPYGCVFGDVKLLPNSRKALEAGEFARDQGMYGAFHAEAFRAYFTEARDIGDAAVIEEIAGNIGLDPKTTLQAVAERRYEDRLRKCREEGATRDVTVLPTFFFSNGARIVGLRSIDVFRKTILEPPRPSVMVQAKTLDSANGGAAFSLPPPK